MKTPPLHPLVISEVISGLLLGLWVSGWTGTTTWHSENGNFYQDTYSYWGHELLSRRFTQYREDNSVKAVHEGPMTKSAKPHGEWKTTIPNELGVEVTNEFWWYGEPITESDWHLRTLK